ncbi:hypothetical protein EUGRSUZ_A01070 [Eucalyptus grandis]|uniref:F-box associated beta-propeller type 3 domain-containing protein n=2 Tax=Eucalyptus grandis TaxID=71139 RepID=A0A059DEP4_EUCGR|nr:hypothetical protein EUGRSUZ_A01070 [Eucalyptus grandis]
MELEPGSGSQSKKGRSDRPTDHLPSPSQSRGVTINGLPREIVVDILSYSPRRPCSEPSSRAAPLTSRGVVPRPSLVFHCDHPLRSQLYFVDDVSGGDGRNRSARKFHPPFSGVTPEFDVVWSSGGLLCLANALYSDNVYVYNPLTGEYRELPDSEGHQRNREMVSGFGFDETEKDYKVIKIVYTIINRNGRLYRVLLCCSKVQVCSLRSLTRRRLGNATHDLEATPSQPLVNRRLHWTTVPVAECMDLRKGRHHLAELGGCLSAAVPSLSGALEIWVMKEHGMKESWIKDYSIGSYLPKGLQNHEHEEYNDPSCKISRILMRKRYGLYVRVLGMLRNGKILLEYHNRALARYDPDRDEAIDLMLEGLPEWFESIVHVSSISRM